MTVSEFIASLGGPTKAAKLFRVTPSAVSNWKAAEALPERVHYRAHLIAQAHGLAFAPHQDDAAQS